jgi:hypothetical protein
VIVSPKVTAGSAGFGTAGAVVVILVWILGLYGIQVPPEVAAAIAAVIGSIAGFFAGHIVQHIEPGSQPTSKEPEKNPGP